MIDGTGLYLTCCPTQVHVGKALIITDRPPPENANRTELLCSG